MYLEFYGLAKQPFQLSADPRFFFGSGGHTRALAYLKYGLSQGDGFIVITGEVGAGKTTLAQYLLSTLDPERYLPCTVVFSQISQESLLHIFASKLGVSGPDGDKGALLSKLEARLSDLWANGKRVILLVDEAQNLGFDALEGLRMLSNIATDGVPMVQTFLLGQPQFRSTLGDPQLLQLRQRIIASCHLDGLSQRETRDYVVHRLSIAGWRDNPRFTRAALGRIHELTEGVPRRINTLCSRLLIHGYLESKTVIRLGDVVTVASELESELHEVTHSPVPEAPAVSEASDTDYSGDWDPEFSIAPPRSGTRPSVDISSGPYTDVSPEPYGAEDEARRLLAHIDRLGLEERPGERRVALAILRLLQLQDTVKRRE